MTETLYTALYKQQRFRSSSTVKVCQWLTVNTHIWRRHTAVCWRYTIIMYRCRRQICTHNSHYFPTACLLCTVGFVTTAWAAWLSIALNLNLLWLALASVYALSLLSHHLFTYNSWHFRPIFRHHQNAWSHTGPKLDLQQACFLTIPQYSFLHPCAPSY